MGLPKGFKHTDETKEKIRRSRMLQDPPMKGKHHTEETKRSISKKRKTAFSDGSINHPMKGRKHKEESKIKISKSNLGKPKTKYTLERRIKRSCSMRDIPIEKFDKFVKYGDYCYKFDEPFKERVREFFGRKCVECGKDEKEQKYRLSVHHVNYDKETCCNNQKPIFVALCTSCHIKTNGNREHWKQRYIEVIHIQYGGNCYIKK